MELTRLYVTWRSSVLWSHECSAITAQVNIGSLMGPHVRYTVPPARAVASNRRIFTLLTLPMYLPQVLLNSAAPVAGL